MATPTQFEFPVSEWFTGEYAAIPARMQEGLKRYVIDRLRPGDFLMAVIQNDLRNAVGHADSDNLPLIPLYVRWFYNVAPSRCHGSPKAFVEWLERVDDVRYAAETEFGVSQTAESLVGIARKNLAWAREDMLQTDMRQANS